MNTHIPDIIKINSKGLSVILIYDPYNIYTGTKTKELTPATGGTINTNVIAAATATTAKTHNAQCIFK